MSTINNIPFDINRTAVEKNKSVKSTGTRPVYQSESIHKPVDNDESSDRRKGNDRRKYSEAQNHNKRHLTERREGVLPAKKSSKTQQALENAHKSGGIIDLEV